MGFKNIGGWGSGVVACVVQPTFFFCWADGLASKAGREMNSIPSTKYNKKKYKEDKYLDPSFSQIIITV